MRNAEIESDALAAEIKASLVCRQPEPSSVTVRCPSGAVLSGICLSANRGPGK
jgi:hypothetical protein